MTNPDRPHGDVRAEWIPAGSPLDLAEARFLRDVLRRKGIRSRIQNDGAAESGVRHVLVRRRDHAAALAFRRQALAEGDDVGGNDLPSDGRKRPSLVKILTAGILGAATGARVGVKFKPAWVVPLAALVFAAFAVAATLLAMHVFRSKPPRTAA